MTLQNIITGLEFFAADQPAVNMIVRQDARRLNDCPDALYGVFAWQQGTHTKEADSQNITYSFTLFYIDRLTADRKNETVIQSTGIDVLGNVLQCLEEYNFIIIGDVQYTPFNYRFADECAGVYATVDITVPLEYGPCPTDYPNFDDRYYDKTIKII